MNNPYGVNNVRSKQNKIAGVNLHFATISEAKILKIQDVVVPENTKKPRLQKVSLRSLSA